MNKSSIQTHFQELLSPLFNAGWSDMVPLHQAGGLLDRTDLLQIALRRSCMVVGVQYEPESPSGELLRFVPVAEHVDQPADGIGLFDALKEPETVVGISHGLRPVVTRDVSARLGLLDPTRFLLSGASAQEQLAFGSRLYARYVDGRVTAKWHRGSPSAALKFDANPVLSDLLTTALYFASGVVPDPVPMAAAIGITLDCWRHTELETAHAGTKKLTDVVMAKLNIATTRSVRRYITSGGIDWEGIGAVLLDPERQLSDGRTATDLIAGKWLTVQASIATKLASWRSIEAAVGPEATLRLASAMGSTGYTSRWWGNGWWDEFAADVFFHVEETFPDLLEIGDGEFDRVNLISQLMNEPDSLPDQTLKSLIDPPDGKGLRYGRLPEIPARRLNAMPRISQP